MANDEEKDFWSKVVGIGGLGILVYVGYEVLKSVFSFHGEAKIYRCGKCQNVVPYKSRSCPFCRVNLQWPNPGLPGTQPFLATTIGVKFFGVIFGFAMLLTIAHVIMLLCPGTENATTFLKEYLPGFWLVILGDWVGMKSTIPGPTAKKRRSVKSGQKTKRVNNE